VLLLPRLRLKPLQKFQLLKNNPLPRHNPKPRLHNPKPRLLRKPLLRKLKRPSLRRRNLS